MIWVSPAGNAHVFSNPNQFRSVMVGLVALSVLSGCGRSAPDYTPYVPSMALAEDAVRQGLDAWKAGQAPGEVPGTRPVVHVTDAGRKAGQLLESYRILGEARGSAGRTIAVVLRLTNPAEEVRVRYIVVGIDPLWVFRQEDYDLLMHWDHHMPASTAEGELPGGDQPQSADDGTAAPSKPNPQPAATIENRRNI